LKGLHPHTHLYFGDEPHDEFPGSYYCLIDTVAPKSSELTRLGVQSADIALRNYPGNVADLRKKLKVSDGGAHRLYGVTLENGQKRLLVCEKKV